MRTKTIARRRPHKSLKRKLDEMGYSDVGCSEKPSTQKSTEPMDTPTRAATGRKPRKKKEVKFNTRSTPSALFQCIKLLKPKQRNDIIEIGFGDILNLGFSHIPVEISEYLVKAYCPSSRVFTFRDGCQIRVSEEDVECTLGLPRGSREIEIKTNVCPSDGLSLWRKQFTTTNERKTESPFKIGIAEVCNQIASQEEGGELFKQNFLVLISTVLVYFGTSTWVNQSLFHAIENVDNAKDFNWCKPVLEGASKAMKNWQPGKCYGGPLTFLLLFYLDRMEYQIPQVNRVFPTMTGWTDKIIKKRIGEEIKSNEIGRGFLAQGMPSRTQPVGSANKSVTKSETRGQSIPKQEDKKDANMDFANDENLNVQNKCEKTKERMHMLFEQLFGIAHEIKEVYESMKNDNVQNEQMFNETIKTDEKKRDSNSTNDDDDAVIEIVDNLIAEYQRKKDESKNREANVDCGTSSHVKFSTPIVKSDVHKPKQSGASLDNFLKPNVDCGTSSNVKFSTPTSDCDVHKSKESGASLEDIANIGRDACNEEIESESHADNIEKSAHSIDENVKQVPVFAKREKRVTMPSSFLISPLKNRRTDYTSSTTPYELQLYEWFMSLKLRKSNECDKIVEFSDVDILRHKEIKTLRIDEWVDMNVIDMWCRFLNCMEQKRDKRGPYRVIVGILPSFYFSQPNYKIEVCHTSLKADLYKSDAFLSRADLISMPYCSHNHFAVLCFDVKTEEIVIFDNLTTKRPHAILHRKRPYQLRDLMVREFKTASNTLYEMFKSVTPRVVNVPWESRRNFNDCGIFTMWVLENYMGNNVWSGELKPEGPEQIEQITLLRYRYFFRLLTLERNLVRDLILEKAKKYCHGKRGRPHFWVTPDTYSDQ